MKSIRAVDNTALHHAVAEFNLLKLKAGRKMKRTPDCTIKRSLEAWVQITNSCFRETYLACLIIVMKQERALPLNMN